MHSTSRVTTLLLVLFFKGLFDMVLRLGPGEVKSWGKHYINESHHKKYKPVCSSI